MVKVRSWIPSCIVRCQSRGRESCFCSPGRILGGVLIGWKTLGLDHKRGIGRLCWLLPMLFPAGKEEPARADLAFSPGWGSFREKLKLTMFLISGGQSSSRWPIMRDFPQLVTARRSFHMPTIHPSTHRACLAWLHCFIPSKTGNFARDTASRPVLRLLSKSQAPSPAHCTQPGPCFFCPNRVFSGPNKFGSTQQTDEPFLWHRRLDTYCFPRLISCWRCIP